MLNKKKMIDLIDSYIIVSIKLPSLVWCFKTMPTKIRLQKVYEGHLSKANAIHDKAQK